MSIVLIFENKDPNPWVNALKTKLPNTKIEVYPDVKNTNDVDFAICWKPKKDVLSRFSNIKVIQSVGASIEHITSTQTIKENTQITRIVDEQLSNDMWEFLLSTVLSELKNSRSYLENQQQIIWQQQAYETINNTTISILGLGQIGGFVAEKFAQIGFNVNGWSNSEKQILNVKSYHGEEQFDAFLNQTDFLINLLPLTKKTKGILNKNTFKKLPKTASVINVGRGEHLIEDDLIQMLDAGELSSAFLDVFINEPLPKTHPFWMHPKIQITPHVASLTNVETAAEQVIENYKLFLNNKTLNNVVSLTKGY